MKARRSVFAALSAAFAVAACGCTSETTAVSTAADASTTVVLDAVMSVVSPLDGACFPVPDSPDATIPITIGFRASDLKPASVILRPQGFCTSLIGSICGHIVVKVAALGSNGAGGAGGAGPSASGGALDPVNNEGVTPTVNVLLRKFSDPYQDFRITVELVGDNGAALLVAKPNAVGTADIDSGVPLERSLIVRARQACVTPTSSSSSGMDGDAGADGG
jgi:hypothetical protein